MSTPITIDSFTTKHHPPHRVYTSASWGGWDEVPYLYCDRMVFACAPEMPQASLRWRYGVGRRGDEATVAAHARLDLVDKFVKIEVDVDSQEEPLRWYGIVVECDDARDGTLERGGANDPSGEQQLSCLGLELLLERTLLEKSIVMRDAYDDLFSVPRAIEFNAENAFGDIGNRSIMEGSEGPYVFARNLRTVDESPGPAHWSSRDIAEYLLFYHVAGISIELSDAARAALPTWDAPRIRCDGASLRAAFNTLCDRRRNLSWRLAIDGSEDDKITLEVFTLNAAEIEVPSVAGTIATIPANARQVALKFDAARQASVRVVEAAAHRCDQVVCRGARIRSIVTLSYDSDTLEADWDTDVQAEFEAGPTTTHTDKVDIDVLVAEFRAQDHFERVFSWFRLPKDWNGMVGTEGGTAWLPAGADDSTTEPEPFYWPELRFDRVLPHQFVPTAPPGGADEALRPFLILKREKLAESDEDTWQYANKMAAAAHCEVFGDGNGRKWSCAFAVQQHAPGLIVRVSGVAGGGQFMIAKDTFTKLVDDDDPELDWRSDMMATVAIVADRRVEARWPADDELDIPEGAVPRRQVIDLKDKAQLVYVPRGTVRRIYGDTLDVTTEPVWLIDDRPQLLAIAKIAQQWYGQPRNAMQVALRDISRDLEVGQLIATIGEDDEEVNSVVTAVAYDLAGGRTDFTTAFGELDFFSLMG